MRSDVVNVCCLVRVPGVCSQPSPEARLLITNCRPGGRGGGGGGLGGASHPLGPVLQEYNRRTPGLPLGCCSCAPPPPFFCRHRRRRNIQPVTDEIPGLITQSGLGGSLSVFHISTGSPDPVRIRMVASSRNTNRSPANLSDAATRVTFQHEATSAARRRANRGARESARAPVVRCKCAIHTLRHARINNVAYSQWEAS